MSSSRSLSCLPSVKKQKLNICINFFVMSFSVRLVYFYLLSQPAFIQFFTYCLMLGLFCQSNYVPLACIFLHFRNNSVISSTYCCDHFFHSIYNKTIIIIRFSFCYIQNNQGRVTGYQLQPLALADNPTLDLDYSGYHKNLIQ